MFKFKSFFGTTAVVSILLAALFTAAAGAEGRGSCADAVAVEADSTFRGFAGAESRFAVALEAPGIVTVELGLAEVDARVGLLSPGCAELHHARVGRDFVVIEEAATRLAFAALRAGTYFVGVASSDPRRPLGDVKLVTRFVETELHPRTLKIGSGPNVTLLMFPNNLSVLKDEDHEVDPDPFLKDEDHEVDPDPFAKKAPREWVAVVVSHPRLTKDEDHEVDPDPFLKGFGEAGDRVLRFAAAGVVSTAKAEAWLAHRIAGNTAGGGFRVLADYPLSETPMLVLRPPACLPDDDHGDTFACASLLSPGGRLSAELANGWGDDEDVYRFRLESLRTVTVEAAGEAVPRIALYDRFGQRLETAGFDGGRALVVRTLSAGEYFVRVSGEGPGVYEVAVH